MNLDQMTTIDLFNLYQDSMSTQSQKIDLGLETDYQLSEECYLAIRLRMIRNRINLLVVDGKQYLPDDHYKMFSQPKSATPEQLDKDLLFQPSEDLDEVMEAVQ
jgi:hypothetical protein